MKSWIVSIESHCVAINEFDWKVINLKSMHKGNDIETGKSISSHDGEVILMVMENSIYAVAHVLLNI